jgi:hypothetical protein
MLYHRDENRYKLDNVFFCIIIIIILIFYGKNILQQA